jgi:hypothetical protein
MPNPFYAIAIFDIRSGFTHRPAFMANLIFVLPLIAGMTGVCHCAQSLVGMEFHELFAWAGLEL